MMQFWRLGSVTSIDSAWAVGGTRWSKAKLRGCFFFNQKPANEMRISDWSSDVCSSDLERLGEGPYTLGNQFSLCDLYLFVFVLWSRRPVLDGKLGTLSHLDAFGERLSARPAVRAALAQEGLVWPATPRTA